MEKSLLSVENDCWLSGVPEATRRYILDNARLSHRPNRSLIYAVGDPPGGLYRVISGEVRLIGYPTPGHQVLAMSVTPGHWFGELSVIDGGPRPHDAFCYGPVEILHLSMARIEAFMQDNPAFLGEVALIACAHQRAAITFIGGILVKSARSRLAELILALSGPGSNGGGEIVHITQEDLAGRTGVTRQHLSLLLRELRNEGAIETRYGRILVVDPRYLEHLANDRAL